MNGVGSSLRARVKSFSVGPPSLIHLPKDLSRSILQPFQGRHKKSYVTFG
jgi:hypothetical protein